MLCSVLLQSLAISLVVTLQAQASYPAYFHNKDNCLYSYIEDGTYQITFPDAEPQEGTLKGIQYDDGKSSCTKGAESGKLFVSFNPQDNNMHQLSIEFNIRPLQSEGYWTVDKAILRIEPSNSGQFPEKEIALKPVDIYASQDNSFSCNALVLQNLSLKKDEPKFKITLKRFQLQPFKELDRVIFAPSHDCAVWITMPVLMGFLLILFITVTSMIGIYLLLEQGNQSSDLKFSKQGGMLMNQAQLDATKG